MPLTPDQAAKVADRLYSELAGRRGEVTKAERYFRGHQPLAYASDEWREFHDRRFEDFADNWCGVVGNSPAERLRLDGFRLGDDAEVMSGDERDLMRVWDLNEGPAQSSQGFLHSIIAKRSCVIVWGEPEAPEIEWERADQVLVAYEPGNRRKRIFAVKAWTEGDLEYLTLYCPDEIWKFQREHIPGTADAGRTASGLYVAGWASALGGGWVPRDVPGEDWPLPNDLGVVPVLEFANRPMLGGEPVSDIAGTMAMQDAINLLWAYLFSAADFASLPARVVMGQEPPKVPVLDKDGQVKGEKTVDADVLKNGRMLYLTGQNAKIGQWESARLDVFTEVINRCVRHVAAQTRTPVHYIVGEMSNVNGETLLAGETGLVKKVEECQLVYTTAIREMFRLVALVQGNRGLADACRTGRVLWKDAQTHTQAQIADAAAKDKSTGVLSAQTILMRRYGMSQDEAAGEIERKRAEDASLLTGDLAAAFAPKPSAG